MRTLASIGSPLFSQASMSAAAAASRKPCRLRPRCSPCSIRGRVLRHAAEVVVDAERERAVHGSVFRGEVACRARLGGNEAVPQVISIQRDARGGAAARELRGSREIVIARIAGRQGLCLSLSDRSRPLRKGG
jgi:hypothetical protein